MLAGKIDRLTILIQNHKHSIGVLGPRSPVHRRRSVRKTLNGIPVATHQADPQDQPRGSLSM